jgi:hypothetical protein
MATFNTTQKYLDYYGLQLFWSKVRAYVIANATKVAATHGTKAEKVDASLHPTSEVWVNLTSAVDAAGTTTYTIDDSNVNKQFGYIDAQMAEIKANAGVTGIKVVDADNTDADDFVKLTFDGSKDGTDGFEKGDVTITLDNSKLDAKVTELETADSNEAASRKADIELLAGAGYTAGTAGAVGSWAATGSPTYKSIETLSKRLVEIDANVVTKIEEKDSVENYVTLEVKSTKAEGTTNDTAVTVTINDSALKSHLDTMGTNHTNEVAARKAADALIAGANWNETGATWTTAPKYQDITEISARMVEQDTAIDALSSATHFRGVYDTLDLALAAVQDYGDIVIVNADGASKEYIYNADPSETGHTLSKDNFVELGDTIEEEARLLYLENWVGNGGDKGNYITDSEINALFVEGWSLGTAPTGRK